VELAGKVALVTGASRGVGAATAVALAAAGCDVACAARSTRDAPQRTPGTVDDTVEQVSALGVRGLAVPTNLADEEEVVAMVATTVTELGRLDILVNNAAVTFVGDLDIRLSRHDLVMDVNYRAPLVAIREAVPHMRAAGGGRIVNVSSVAALQPVPGLMTYGVSKIALERLTVDAARQLQADGIACNVFRIDIPVASEGFVRNAPGVDTSTWEPTEVAAEGIVWLLSQPAHHSGRRESMHHLRERERIMASRSQRPHDGPTPVGELVDGLVAADDTVFTEPYED
jgi:citronellol/citronellal dehydrogenase